MWQLQGFDSEDFVKRYWQKKPCVLRNAFADAESRFTSLLSPEELAGLACEEEVHCRLVIEKDGDSPWQVRYGPFEEQDFLELPSSHYSLLVSECEKWLPELADLLNQFRFIPDWRIDDLMISYASAEGSVGPHIDEYDVFLLQTMGTRRWQFCSARTEQPQLIPGLELAILKEFSPDQEIVLNPGDMLYLPPGIAHHGVALEPCMTYSIGFRAPTAADSLESFALEIAHLDVSLKRYGDPELELDRHHAEITDSEIDRFRSLAIGLLQLPESPWKNAVGKMLSDSAIAPPEDGIQPLNASDLQARNWIRHPETRIFYHQTENNISVYYNGQVYELPQDQQTLGQLQQLCEQREWPTSLINACIETGPLEGLLLELASNGAMISIDD